MRRAGLTYCADVDAPRFKLLRQRDQLPFHVPKGDGAEKWADYTLEQAFELRLMLDLIGGEGDGEAGKKGLGPETAAKIVANAMGKLAVHPLEQTEPGDVWAGVAIFDDYVAEGVLRRTAWFGGPMQDLGAWIEKERQPFMEGGQPSEVVRVFLANASRAARFVRQRALELGLPEGEA